MRSAVRLTTLVAVACLGMAPPQAATAQQMSAQNVIVALWGDFIEKCTPFIEDPRAARNALPMQGEELYVAETPDGRNLDYWQDSLEEGKSFYVDVGETETGISFGCGVTLRNHVWAEDAAPLAHSFETILAQTDNISWSGGLFVTLLEGGTNRSEAASLIDGRYNYLLAGVFSGHASHVSAYITRNDFSLDVVAFLSQPGLSK